MDTIKKENENTNKSSSDLDIDKIKEQAYVFLNDFNDNIPNSFVGAGAYINDNYENSSWFYGSSDDDLMLILSLLIKQISEEIDKNKFEVLLHLQTKLQRTYPEEYEEFVKMIEQTKGQ